MTANDEILGFGAHMDISDIQRAINEIIGGLDKIGIKTDTLSKRMNDAMNEIARSTDDSATKQKHAMDVLAQGVAEAKNALANYPEQLRQAKNEADATAQATARLEAELNKLNSQLSGAVVGSKTYDDLKHSIAGVEQQVANNNALHEAQLTTIQEMEAGYNGLISVYGVAASATGANAIAHGSVAVAVGGEAAAHTENASKIEDETKAVLENKTAKDFQIEGEEKISQAVEQETSAYADLISRMQEGKVSSEEYARILSELRQRISDLRTEAQSINVKIETEQEKLNTSNMVNGQLVSMGDENAVNKLIQQYNVLNGQIGALEGILSSVENAWGRLHGTAKQSQSEITEEVKRTTEAEREMNAEADKQPSGFRVQWNTVNELHHKIRELTSQLREHEAEYDKISEKPGFDTQSKKARELEETIARLRKEIGETKRELEETPKGAGGFLAHWKNRMEDFMTGNGKFQDSLGDMKGALSGLLAPFTAATSGAMNFTKALWAMTATPIGKIISVIVLGLQAIHTYLMKDAEGQRAFAKISAYVGSLLSSITDIAVRIGKYLFHAFSDPQGALNQFGRGLVGMVINPLKAVANTLAGVGQVAKGIIDWIKAGRSFSETQRALGEISKGWESLKKAAGNVTDTVKSVWDAGAGAVTGTYELIKKGLKETWETNLADAGAKMFENARMAATLTEQELDAQKQLSEAKRDEQELEIRIAREREKIYTLTGKEKDAQIEKVKNLLKEKYEPQIAAQQKLLEIQQKRNRLHTVSLEQLSKEREAQTAVYAVQARAASSTRMLVRMQQANLKSMASTSKKDARQQQQIDAAETNYDEVVRKNAMEQAKVMTSLEHALADARISAMKDGEEKYLAEKKRALENELEQLDEQRKDAIEKERENQRKEFEAREKIIKSRGGTTKQWSDDEIDQSAIDAINKKYEELRRLTVARQQQDEYRKQIQAQYDYLKEFGSVQEQKYAIAKEYELKVQEAENEWEKKSLEAEKKRVLEQIDINVLKTEIDWTTIFDGFSDAFQDQIEKTLDKIERYMQTDEFKALDASNKREYINMRNQLNDSKGNKVGTFNFSIYREIGRNLEEYQQALLEEKNAHQQHTLALEALHDADKELKAAEEQVKDAIKSGNADAVSMANVRVAGARVERDNAQSNVYKTIQRQKDTGNKVSDAQVKLRESTNEARKAIDNFGNALKQMSDGTLRGFADGLVNLYNAITGNGLTNGLSGLGMLKSKGQKLVNGVKNAADTAGSVTVMAGEATEAMGAAVSEGKDLAEGAASAAKDLNSKSKSAVGELGSVVAGISAAAGESGNMWGMIVAAILDILDALGDKPTEFFDELFTKIFDAILGIINSLFVNANNDSTGLIPPLVKTIIDAVYNFIEGLVKEILNLTANSLRFGIDLWGSDNHDEMVKYQEKLTRSIESTTHALSKMTEELEKSYGVFALTYGDKANSLIKQNMDAIVRGIDSVLQDNYGGGHSDYYHLNKHNSELSQIAKYGQQFGLNVLDTERGNRLTWDQLIRGNDSEAIAQTFKYIRENDAELWRQITQEFGYNEGALEEWLNKLIDTYEQFGDVTKQLKEQILGTEFDGVFDNFMDEIYNLGDGAKDVFNNVAQDWQKMMNKMVLNNAIGQKYRDQLEKWYEQWYNAYVDDNEIGSAEIQQLRSDYDSILRAAADEVNALREQGIIRNTNNPDQQATYNSLEKWTYDQADELINHATAMQILEEHIYETLQERSEYQANISAMLSVFGMDIAMINENIALTVELQTSMDGHLQAIRTNTAPISEIRDLVKKIYNDR